MGSTESARYRRRRSVRRPSHHTLAAPVVGDTSILGPEVERRVKALVVGWRALRTYATPEQWERIKPSWLAFIQFKDAMLASGWARLNEGGQLETAEKQFMDERRRLSAWQKRDIPIIIDAAPGLIDRMTAASETGLSSAVLWLGIGAVALYMMRGKG